MKERKVKTLPQGWEMKTLGGVSKILNGGTPKTKIKEYWGGNINWITPKDLGKLETKYAYETPRKITDLGLNKSSAKLFAPNSIVLSTRAPIGHLAINKEPMSTNQGCRGIIPKEGLDVHFLYYFLKSNVTLLNNLGTGTTFKELSTKALSSVNIPIPPLPQQKQIVARLDAAFAKIEQAKVNLEKNIANARELFQSKLNEVFSQKGEGWEERKLLEVITLKSGKTIPKTLEKKIGDVPYLKISDMNIQGNENSITTSSRFVNKNDIKKGNILPEGTTIFPKRGGAIATNKKRITKIPICVDLNTMGAIPKSSIDPEYLYFYFLGFDLLSISNGTTIPQINNYSFEALKISVPINKMTQKQITNTLNDYRTFLNQIQQSYSIKLQNLEELKKSLLQKAFAGELV